MTTSRTPANPTASMALSTAELEPVVIEHVEGKGRWVLERGTLSVGAAKDCDIQLSDPTVSRYHVTLELHPGEVLVRDAGSRNGTWYLSARVNEARVPLGGSIRLGRATLRLSPLPDKQVPISSAERLGDLIGRSLAMRRLFATLERAAPSDLTLLITGETGVGKEAVARTLHRLSGRAAHPFLSFDCAGANVGLIESELFGHRRGAFTGADSDREGLLEAVGSGTLLLDEVGDLPEQLQTKLLRVLESKTFVRLGDSEVCTFQGRILATTQRNLSALIATGAFRSDLYYRIAGSVLEVPPLRDRREDIPLLVEHFIQSSGMPEVALAPATMAAMQAHSWPGNVRELANAVQRALVLPEESSAPVSGGMEAGLDVVRDKVVDAFEKAYLEALILKHRNNLSAAARAAKLHRPRFYRLLQKHGLTGSKE